MQNNIQKIIAVLNDMSMIDEVLRKTFSYAVEYDASVEVLYVHESPLFDVPDYFRSDTEESAIDKAKIKTAIEKKVETFKIDKPMFVFVQIDDTENRVWTLAREDKETLIITSYYKGITEKLLSKIKQPVLVIKTDTETYQKIALVLDVASDSRNCITHVQQHFAQSEIELFYDYRYIVDTGMEVELQNNFMIEETQKTAFEALKSESGLKGEFFIDGAFADRQMSTYIQDNTFDLLYVCAQDDEFFSSDTLAISLLDTLGCDMLVSSR